tara:strand:- start:1218 stop:1430 length:213 start_codon:yes stop_codon:yes gene_type:complete
MTRRRIDIRDFDFDLYSFTSDDCEISDDGNLIITIAWASGNKEQVEIPIPHFLIELIKSKAIKEYQAMFT